MGRGARRGLAVLGAAAVAVTMTALPAAAQPQVTTDYPAVDVAAGDQIDIDLDVTSSTTETVQLAVTEAPDGWTTALRAGGYNVRAVTANPQEPATVTLEISVPPDADAGDHRITVTATSDSGSDELPLDLRVTEAATSAVTLDTEFPTLRGGTEDTFRYSVTLQNDVPEETTFALAAQGPEGWDITANPSSESRANTVTVGAGESATITVEATPSPGTQAGTYPILLEVSGGGRTAQLELAAEVVGAVQLELNTVNERLNASGTAGNPTTVTLVVANAGSAPLTGVELTASPPSDWEVAFEPATVDVVPPGESATVEATITPGGEAVVGDYVVTLTASSDQREDSIDVRFTVETSPGWGIAAVSTILVAVVGLTGVFRRYGRR